MTPKLEDGTWQSVAEQVSEEMDPAKLTVLVAKLCRAFEIEDEKRQKIVRVAVEPSTLGRSHFQFASAKC